MLDESHEGVPGDRGGSQDPSSHDVLEVLADLFVTTRASRVSEVRTTDRSSPRSSCGGGWPARGRRDALYRAGQSRGRTATTRASNGKLRDELLNGEIFYSLQEAKVLIEQWRREYNTVRPHSSLGYLPPASEVIRPDPKLLNLPLLLGPRPRQNEAVGLTL